MKQKFQKWDQWLDTILNEVGSLVMFQFVYRELQSTIDKNKGIQKPSLFYDFMFSSYAAWAVMTVRRIVKSQKDSVSFTGLLKDMKINHILLTRERFVSLYTPEMKDCAEGSFDRISGAKSLSHIASDMLSTDIAELEAVTNAIEVYADKIVAHHDQRKLTKLPTWDDLEKCISVIEKLALKYQFLLRARDDDTLLPAILYNWKEVFYIPWLSQGEP
jgi:hypothetical protein